MPADSTPTGPPGTRVAVRYELTEPDPVTGARFTDVTGTLVEATQTWIVVDSRRGRIRVPRAAVIATRIIPPRPSRRGAPHRSLSVEDLERVMVGAWPPVERARLGDWLLRAGYGFTIRANSALALGSAGLPHAAALESVGDWYAQRSLRPRVTVALPTGARLTEDSVAEAALAAGWSSGASVLVQTAASRTVVQSCRASAAAVEVTESMTDDWYAGLASYREAPRDAAQAVLHGSPAQRFALIRGADGAVAGVGRLGVSDGWGGLGAMWVREDRRRGGLAEALMGALATEAVELGCVSLHIQVDAANAAAISLYRRAGFATHHSYGCLSL